MTKKRGSGLNLKDTRVQKKCTCSFLKINTEGGYSYDEEELKHLEYLEMIQKIDEAIQEGAKCPDKSVNFRSWKHGCSQGQTRTGRGDG